MPVTKREHDELSFLVVDPLLPRLAGLQWTHYVHVVMDETDNEQVLDVKTSGADVQIFGKRLHSLFQLFMDNTVATVHPDITEDPDQPYIRMLTITLT